MDTSKTAIVIPAYNAERTVGRTLARIAAAGITPGAVLVVDDGSRDRTVEVARRAGVEHHLPVEILVHHRNRGYGGAQKTAFRRALERGFAIVMLVHADGQYAPEEYLSLLAPIDRERADMVVGSRVLGGALRGGMPPLRWLGNRLISALENLVFGLKFVEYHSGYVAYSAEALERIAFETLSERYHFDGEMLMCAGKLGLRVAEVPVSTHFGPETSSLAVAPYLLEVSEVLLRYARGGYFFQS